MNRADAWQIVCEFVASDALRRHMLAVEAAMRYHAARLGGDVELWGAVGLLHDFDYERWPDPPAHTREGARILRERGVDEEIVGAILSHAEWNHDQYPLDRPLRKTLFAVDELCGFIYACALVRPQRLEDMTASSVKKKLKTAAFAANVSRDHIHRGAALLDMSLDDHITHGIAALHAARETLGLMPAG